MLFVDPFPFYTIGFEFDVEIDDVDTPLIEFYILFVDPLPFYIIDES